MSPPQEGIASTLYDLVQCPQRVALDAFGNIANRDEPNGFVQLMWERGTLFEHETIRKSSLPFLDLSNTKSTDRERLTLEAMARGEPLIYGGCITAGDLTAMPHLLRNESGGYFPGTIKSGRGKEAGDDDPDGKRKRHYAVQLALYVDILERLNFSAGRRAFVLDVQGDEITYDFGDPPGRSLWEEYENALEEARSYLRGKLYQFLPTPMSVSFAIGIRSASRSSPHPTI
jgi:hypothetical protein